MDYCRKYKNIRPGPVQQCCTCFQLFSSLRHRGLHNSVPREEQPIWFEESVRVNVCYRLNRAPDGSLEHTNHSASIDTTMSKVDVTVEVDVDIGDAIHLHREY